MQDNTIFNSFPISVGFEKIPPLPERCSVYSMVITPNDELMVIGSPTLKLVDGKWLQQSPLTKPRHHSVVIPMENGVFCFGGTTSSRTSDFLLNGHSDWQAGPLVPEPGIEFAAGVAISQTELILVGESILKYNIDSQQWTDLGSLYNNRWGHKCFLFNGKIVVTGGVNGDQTTNSTEIIDVSNNADVTTRIAGNLNDRRRSHGMGIVSINGKAELIVFGGCRNARNITKYRFIDSVEIWNDKTETWIMSSMKLSEPIALFGYCGYCQLPSI